MTIVWILLGIAMVIHTIMDWPESDHSCFEE